MSAMLRHLRIVGPLLMLLLAARVLAAEPSEAQLRERLAAASGTARVDVLNDLSKSQWGVSSDETIRWADQAIAAAHAIGYAKGEAAAMRNKAIGYWYSDNYAPALDLALRALAMYEKLGDEQGVVACHSTIGTIYLNLERFPEALKTYRDALPVAEKIGDRHRVGMLHLNIGTTLLGLEQPAEALGHFNEARTILEKDGTELDVLSALANIGGALRRLKRYDEALRIDEEILTRATKSGLKVRVADAMTDIGDVLDLMGRSDDAVAQLRKAIDYCTTEKLKRNLEDAEEVMVRVLEKRGDYRGALAHQKSAAAARKERITEENTAAMAELNVKYESEKKERQIREQQLRIERGAYVRNLIIAGALVALVLLGWTWSRYRAKQREAALHEHLSRTDPLTGLANRRALLATLEREIARTRRDGTALSLVIVDVDHFKTFNDTWGHDTGDEVLVRAARALKGALREVDVLARWGGEEFLAMLPDASADAARIAAERMCEALKNVTIERGEELLHITATFGVSPLSPREAIDDCLKRADEALYRGKESGRDCVIVLEPPLQMEAAS